MEALLASEPGKVQWQWVLAVSYGRIGDVQQEQGDLAGALKSYLDSLAIMEALSASGPGNAQWQSDLSASYSILGLLFEDETEARSS
jgi:hypothetical protein